VASRERPVDRGTRLGRAALERTGRELRVARTDRGLSCAAVGAAIGISAAEVSRIERGLSPRVPVVTLARIAAVAGLDLVLGAYPGPGPLRDSAHARLLADFRGIVHPTIGWATEVPLPISRDQRSWDAMLTGPGWRFGVEAETAPGDAQALIRRLRLKERDGAVDGIFLIVRETRRVREFLAAAHDVLTPVFPVSARVALASLRAGSRPSGNAVLVVPHGRRTAGDTPHVTRSK
jgi:transcriptional regulator with XRE-family HTH domain